VSFSIVQAALVGPTVSRLGERVALVMGLAFGAVGFAIYGLAPTGWWFFAGIPIMSLWGFYGPAAQGMMSRRVAPNEQGQLQGALAGVVTLAGIAGPAIFAITFQTFIGRARDWHLPGAPYLLASALLLVAIGVAWRLTHSAVPAAGTMGAA
jgi:DHA1 family tetracycline resistance protein-like MFS transporter